MSPSASLSPSASPSPSVAPEYGFDVTTEAVVIDISVVPVTLSNDLKETVINTENQVLVLEDSTQDTSIDTDIVPVNLGNDSAILLTLDGEYSIINLTPDVIVVVLENNKIVISLKTEE
jgi:hypothetical protein